MSSSESSDESYAERGAKNPTLTKQRPTLTPRKRKVSDDEPYITSQQRSNQKRNRKTIKNTPNKKKKMSDNGENISTISTESHKTTPTRRNPSRVAVRSRESSLSSYMDAESDSEFNVSQNTTTSGKVDNDVFRTPKQRAKKKYQNTKTKRKLFSDGTNSNSSTNDQPQITDSAHNVSEHEANVPLRRNPSRRSRETSVASYTDEDGEQEVVFSKKTTAQKKATTVQNIRKPRKDVSKERKLPKTGLNQICVNNNSDSESVTSLRRNPLRRSRESSVVSYAEFDGEEENILSTLLTSPAEKVVVGRKTEVSSSQVTKRRDEDEFIVNTNIDENEPSNSSEEAHSDEDYLTPIQKRNKKYNGHRITGKDLILKDLAHGDSDVSSGDDVQSPKCVSPLKIGEYKPCKWCEALKFGDDEYCCRGGTVFIPPMEALPKQLADLFGDTPEARKFKKSILTYNTLFSMASLQRHGIPAAPHGLPVQKVQGVVDAYPSAVFPHNPNQPAFANFYVFHGQEAVNMRTHMFQSVDKDIVKKIQDVMDEHNEMAKNYNILKYYIDKNANNPKIDVNKHIRMKIINAWDVDNKTLQGHKNIYRTVEQKSKDYLAVFYSATVEQHDIDLPGLIIYPRRGPKNIRPIHYWNNLVDPLCYPLFFPYGEYGYKKKSYPLFEKHEKHYWLRLAEHWENFPSSAVNSESIKQIDEVKRLAAFETNGSEEEDETVETTEDAHVRILPITPTETETSGNHELARQFQEEVEMEEARDIDYADEREDLDDTFCEQNLNELEDTTGVNDDISESGDSDNGSDDANDNGDDSDSELPSKAKKRTFASQREYIVYQYQERKHILNRFLNCVLLSQLFLIHVLTRILRGRYDKMRQHITQKVATTKSKAIKVMDKTAARKGIALGIVTLLSEKIAGSPRWLQQKFENTVALSNKLGPPDFFMTATCNTEWPEIKKHLKPGQTWADHPFLVNNVFVEKFKKLLDLILGKRKKGGKGRRPNEGIFGKVSWYSYSVEFQQRGPPHVHMVFSLRKHIKTVAQIEKAVQAHLPRDPALRELVEKFMIHRPCEGDHTAYCRPTDKYKKSTQCKKNFPKEFAETTKHGDRHYPEYYRPNDGERTKTGADNRYVVPYNSTLLSAWQGHINLEVVSALRVVKYIFKYLFKGFDRVLVETVTNCDNIDMSQMTVDGHLIYPKGLKIPPGALEKRKADAIKHLKRLNVPLTDINGKEVLVYDELLIVQDMRAVTSCEAAWDLARFPRHGCSHTVLEQGVHEENEEPLFFDPEKLEEVEKQIKEDKIDTKLKAWFKLNAEDPAAHDFTYDQIPLFYTFKNGKWVPKERYDRCVLARILTVPPRNREAFAIRILCQNRKGIKSFEDLRTVDGKLYDDFTAAAKALRLMNDQKEWEECLREAAAKANPCQMRRLFMQILTNNEVVEPLKLYIMFREEFFERRDEWSEETKEAHSLYHMESYLSVHGKKLEHFGLPAINLQDLPPKRDLTDDSGRQPEEVSKAFANKLRAGLQDEQAEIFEKVFNSVMQGNRDESKKNAFFLQGSGGTGKTVFMKALYYNLLAEKKKVACVAHTGIAASLLPIGTTAHRFFHIPLRVEERMNCQVELEQAEAAYIAQFDCVIWDEATMTDRRVYDAVDRLMRHLHPESRDRLFGGVHFVLAGDWKQTLPIVNEERSVGLVKYTLLKWQEWDENFEVFELTKNRRAAQDKEFANYLEDLGWGRANLSSGNSRPEDQLVNLPAQCLMGNENDVIQKVFGGPGSAAQKLKFFKDSAILTVDNKTTFDINKKVLNLLTTKEHTFLSVDAYDEKTGLHALNPETYHRVTPSGFPPHELKLKVGAIVILLRNLNVSLGLTNGTRLRILEIGETVLRLKHVEVRKNIPDEVLLTKLSFAPFNATNREVAFTRKQFPIRLSFCITCNRAQGQTLKRAGLILRSPCFSHGQLYVALSRVRTRSDLFIFNGSSDPTKTNNVIFPSVFSLLKQKLTGPLRLRGPRMQTTICAIGTDGEISEILLPQEDGNNSLMVAENVNYCDFDFYEDDDGPSDPEEQIRILNAIYEEELARKKWSLEDYEANDDPMSPEERVQILTLYEELCKKDETENVRSNTQIMNTAQNDSGSDIEYDEFFDSNLTIDRSNKNTQKKRNIKIYPNVVLGELDGPLRLLQLGNNCYANTAVQVLYRLFKNDILHYEESNGIMLKLKEVVTGRANTNQLVKMNTGEWDPEGKLRKYNNSAQHDTDEYLIDFLDVVGSLRNSVNVEELIQDNCSECNAIKNRAVASFMTIQIKAGQTEILNGNLRTLEDFVCSMESMETLDMSCVCRNNDQTAPHVRKLIYCIPDATTYLCVKIELYTQHGFVERNIQFSPELSAFGCVWEPIVMLEHSGNIRGGHYVAYLKNDDSWDLIDAVNRTRIQTTPDMSRIKLIILQKTGTDYTCGERQSMFAAIKTSLYPANTHQIDPEIAEIDARTSANTNIAQTISSKAGEASAKTSRKTVPSVNKSVRFSQKRILQIVQKNMLQVQTEGIVNAANPQLQHGGGVCGLIFDEAGRDKMEKACNDLLVKRKIKELPPGEAAITSAFQLRTKKCRAKYVIHTAAPRPAVANEATKEDECYLRQCYLNACRVASHAKISKLVFPFLGIGLYNYGTKAGISVAIQSVLLFFELNPTSALQQVVFATLDRQVFKIATGLISDTEKMEFYDAANERSLMEQRHGQGNVNHLKEDGTSISVATFVQDPPKQSTLKRGVNRLLASFKSNAKEPRQERKK